MQLLRWSKAHEVYVPELDAEHRGLFRLTQELYEAVLADAPAAQVHSRFRNLVAGLDDHLAHEERLMRATGYPSYAWHKQSHDGARKKAKKWAQVAERGDRETLEPILRELAAWLKEHLALADLLMAAHLRNYRRTNRIAS